MNLTFITFNLSLEMRRDDPFAFGRVSLPNSWQSFLLFKIVEINFKRLVLRIGC